MTSNRDTTKYPHHHTVIWCCNLEWSADYVCENSAAAFSSLQHWREEECGWQWQERETCNEKFGCSHDSVGRSLVFTYRVQTSYKTFGCCANILWKKCVFLFFFTVVRFKMAAVLRWSCWKSSDNTTIQCFSKFTGYAHDLTDDWAWVSWEFSLENYWGSLVMVTYALHYSRALVVEILQRGPYLYFRWLQTQPVALPTCPTETNTAICTTVINWWTYHEMQTVTRRSRVNIK